MPHTALQQHGYLFRDAPGDLPPEPEIRALSDSWNDLPPDAYLRAGQTHRERRYARFAVPLAGEIERLPHRPFTQSSMINSYAGDTPRDFAPMHDAVVDSPVLRALLASDASRLDPARLGGTTAWHVDAHQIRTVATQSATGDPAPEGPHRDGMSYVAVHLINRENAAGGESVVYTETLECIDRRTLTEPFDSLLILDERLLHDATPIACAPGHSRATRDTLLFGFRPYTPDLDDAGFAYG